MPLLYTCAYHDANTGRRFADCDFDRPAPAKAEPGELVHCANVNGDRHEFWLDDHGRRLDRAPWQDKPSPNAIANPMRP